MKKTLAIVLASGMIIGSTGRMNVVPVFGMPHGEELEKQIQMEISQALLCRPKSEQILCEFLNKLNGVPQQLRDCQFPSNRELQQIIEKDDVTKLQKRPIRDVNLIKIDKAMSFYPEQDTNFSTRIPLLHYCVMRGAIQCFNFLLLNGANPSTEIKNRSIKGAEFKWDCMAVAVASGNWEAMEILEKMGVEKFKNLKVWEAAALTHRNDLLEQLLSDGRYDQKCLQIALQGVTKGNNLKGLKLLLSKGVDVNAKDNCGRTPVHTAAINDRDVIGKMLINKGADVNVKDADGQTPLHKAAGNDSIKVAELLISKGADVNAKDADGRTPLREAAYENDSIKVAELLISKGADVNAKDVDGRTPLYEAAGAWSSIRVGKLLISKGADVNAKDINGETPLHVAAKDVYSIELAEQLINKGADVNAKDNDGNTPLDIAKQYSSHEMEQLLSSKDENV